MTHAGLMEMYESGAITRMEFFLRLMIAVRDGTQADRDFVLSLDEEWTAALQQYLCCRPETDEQWDKLRTFAIGMYARDTDWELVRAMEREETRQMKRGVEFCRSVLPKPEPRQKPWPPGGTDDRPV